MKKLSGSEILDLFLYQKPLYKPKTSLSNQRLFSLSFDDFTLRYDADLVFNSTVS